LLTPEGARDYVVPSRIQKGKFYALPQSPQLLKQILMVSGFDRYFQLARCLRDEDLRSDRQPEHTQLDLEMSYVTPEDVWAVIEVRFSALGVTRASISRHYGHPTLGIDKPDLRFGMEIVDLTDIAGGSDFKVFADNVRNGGVVKGIVMKGAGGFSRKQVDDLTALAKETTQGAYSSRGNGDRADLEFIGEMKDRLLEKVGAASGTPFYFRQAPQGRKILGRRA
jgi:aspartyl-tRNA synthetase